MSDTTASVSRRSRLRSSAAVLAAIPLALTALPATAVTGGTPVADADTTYAYTAQVIVGNHDRGCSAALVDTEWLLTTASCFAADPAASLTVQAGAPRTKTTAVIGRANLSGTQGAQRRVVELVPRTDRDVVLARLDRPVTNVAPAALATTAPAAGSELTFAGYGRTKTAWAPLHLHTGKYAVDAVAATSADVTGTNGTAACSGDAGGPVISGGKLVGLTSRSFQGGCFGVDETQTSTAGVIARVDDLKSWIDSKVGATPIVDFNGDGVEDITIGDPQAVVAGKSTSGVVRIVYGGGKGTAEINQDLGWVPGDSESGDYFGEVLDTVDYNEDGYTDLVTGTPSEDIGTATNAGVVDILFGGPSGLGTGTEQARHFEQGQGAGGIKASGSEAGDRMGHAVAAGRTGDGEPYLVIGVPGESLVTASGTTAAKAGMAIYLRGSINISINQDKADVPGGIEANDGIGTAIAADAHHIAIGAPNEDIGGDDAGGTVLVFSHTLHTDGHPKPLFGMDQDLDTVSGGAEVGDEFGASLDLVEYRPAGAASATDSFLVVGAPGEGLVVQDGEAERAQAGAVYTFKVTNAGSYTQTATLWQGTADDAVTGTTETGDRYGEKVDAVNIAPRDVSSGANLRVAISSPGEAIGATANAGAVTTLPLLGAVGDSDYWIQAGSIAGLPGTPGANQYVGRSIHFIGTHLYIGTPYSSPAGAAHALPWSNVSSDTKAAVTSYTPGTGGLPAAGVRFGYAVR